jgi:hypothetical protein
MAEGAEAGLPCGLGRGSGAALMRRRKAISDESGLSQEEAATTAKKLVKARSPGRRGIFDLRNIFLQRLHRLEQCNQLTLAHRLDHQTIAVTAHDRFIARELELHRDADRLIAAIAE